jgi:integrase
MKRRATPSAAVPRRAQAHAGHFIGVRDSRNRRIAGLYTRNGRFYGQLWMAVEKTAKKFALVTADGVPVETLNEAKEAMEVLRTGRRNKTLPTLGVKPSLAAYIETYFAKAEIARKKPDVLSNERYALRRWCEHLGDVRIDRISPPLIASFRDKRLHSGRSPRTVNLDQVALRNVLKRAVDDGHLLDTELSALRMKTLKVPRGDKRELLTPAEFERLLAAVPCACAKNAEQFADYLRFLAYSGAREQEALKIRWVDVDFDEERVLIGAGGVSKNRESREVEFNDRLGELLRDMHARRAPDCSWLFPSPQRGRRDEHARTFRESLLLTRRAAKLEWVGFHDLRHWFASFCVMAGLDFMTIAAWMGHKDGGILVGKVYGHLLQDHRRKAAQKVSFGLAVLPRKATG